MAASESIYFSWKSCKKFDVPKPPAVRYEFLDGKPKGPPGGRVPRATRPMIPCISSAAYTPGRFVVVQMVMGQNY